MKLEKISKNLSYILRHNPSSIDLTLDKNGWADVKSLLKQLSQYGKELSMTELEWIVDNNNKKRFAFNDKKTKIRASQGHSIDIDLNLEEKIPPQLLYHGTSTDTIAKIHKGGLKKMSRQHVHLSADKETAFNVGKRHGESCVFIVESEKMLQYGYKFYESENGVWLTDNVPAEFIVGIYYSGYFDSLNILDFKNAKYEVLY